MNHIGIIGAMEAEIEQLKDHMKIERTVQKASMEFCQGILSGKEVVVVRSGIGKVNAAVCAQILVDEFEVEYIINTGIAGSLKNEINIGDIVLSSDAVQHDVDAIGFGYKIGEIPRMKDYMFKADEDLIKTAKEVCEEVNKDINVFVGRVATGDQFISDQEVKKNIKDNFQAFCVEMEGAAIAQTAYLNNVQFLIIRAISDKADNSAIMNSEEFEAKAIRQTVELVLGLVNKLQ